MGKEKDSVKENKIIRVEGIANSYGIGEFVTEDKRVVLFRAGDYNLTRDQLLKKLNQGHVVEMT